MYKEIYKITCVRQAAAPFGQQATTEAALGDGGQ
jgi:hypothetical protein